MVYRIYVEKKRELAHEAATLAQEIRTLLGITALTDLRVLCRYDVEHIDKALFDYCKTAVFSEPQIDIVSDMLDADGAAVLAVEYLPGQFDQRADSAAQCIQIISQGERPAVRTCKVYFLYGEIGAEDLTRIKKHVINPIETREASLEPRETLEMERAVPGEIAVLDGFTVLDDDRMEALIETYGLAMDLADLCFCRDYFRAEGRDPTITELRVIDTYWSDHCRHTTFLTTVDNVRFEDPLLESVYADYLAMRTELGRTKPVSLMDIATIVASYLRKNGKLPNLDESEEVNACTVKINVDVNGDTEPWLLFFKNETHNHPTEIEPFGGAATCIGGAIRDPLSGRSYVYAAMRVTGAADPLQNVQETLPGKLPQRKIVTSAAAGYSSYGNQIGIATGIVDELYHPNFVAKRMEIGAVIGAACAQNVRRVCPTPGDRVILLGGRTGRDGCGGATGSSKSHDVTSLENCGTQVQKGNAPEERKLQRLFRNPEVSRLIKRCNDFGAGGVSVAIGELADGLSIDLDAIPKKYAGLDGTELAISESQERMAVVVACEDVARFLALADEENLEATVVALVTAEPRLVMHWNGRKIVDLSRAFLSSNGAEKHIEIAPEAPRSFQRTAAGGFLAQYGALAVDLSVCSKRGLSERFDSTIGAGTVLMPFGGRHQVTPIQAMAHKISMEEGETDTCSLMSWGYNPYICEQSPFHGAYLAVVESVSKLIATGAQFSEIYLSFQEYFEKPGKDARRWGKPLSAILGAFEAQKQLGIAAIGGKDSMSGSFGELDVPPTLVSFAVTTASAGHIVSPEFRVSGHRVIWLRPEYDEAGLPETESLKRVFSMVHDLLSHGLACAAWTPVYGGVAEGIMKMAFGNGIGFAFDDALTMDDLFGYAYGSFILELTGETPVGIPLGVTTKEPFLTRQGETLALEALLSLYERRLEPVYPVGLDLKVRTLERFDYHADKRPVSRHTIARPRVLIPVFPGTNCEYDSARAISRAGGIPEVFVINNLTADGISHSLERFQQRLNHAQIVFIPGGFSGGDEPDGSGKFITAFFRNSMVRDAVSELLEQRDGLICGICNGFQALIKLGLVPFGRIIDMDASCPTLTYNAIGRHQSRLARVRISSNKSPWLMHADVGSIYTIPISHGEGRFWADEALIRKLAENGQIATQYVDDSGEPTSDIRFNPNGSAYAIEGITSPDGRVFGKMGHSERIGPGLYKNVEGDYDMGIFASAIRYYQ